VLFYCVISWERVRRDWIGEGTWEVETEQVGWVWVVTSLDSGMI